MHRPPGEVSCDGRELPARPTGLVADEIYPVTEGA